MRQPSEAALMSLTHDLTPDGCNQFTPLLKSPSELILRLGEGNVHIPVTLVKYWWFFWPGATLHVIYGKLAKIHQVFLVDSSFVEF